MKTTDFRAIAAGLSLRITHLEKALQELEDDVEKLYDLYYRLSKNGFFELDGSDVEDD